MHLITVQSKHVLDILLQGKVYRSAGAKGNLAQSYKYLEDMYGYSSAPIFCGKIGSLCEFSGIHTENAYILQLNVPNNYCKVQSYYDWCDVIYYMEDPEEWDSEELSLDTYISNVVEGNYIDDNTPVQVTIPYILPEWLIDYTPYTVKFDSMHNGSGGSNILKTIDFYKS